MSTEALSIHPSDLPRRAAAARVAFVGAGPGDLGLMTVRARDYLAAADVVVLDSPDLVDELEPWTRDDVDFVLTSTSSGRGRSDAARVKLLVRAASRYPDASHLVVRLLAGDPVADPTLTREATGCYEAGVPFEIVPGVATAWSVPAYAGMPLSGSVGQGGTLHLIDADDTKTDWTRSVADDVTVVVLGCGQPLQTALGRLLEAGRDPQTPVALTEHGTTVRQQTSVLSLADTVEALASGAAACPDASIAVVGQQVELRSELSWWESRPLFGWSVLVPRTKEQSGSMTERIAAYGATSSVVPTISVEPPRTPQQMDRAVRGLVTGRYEWIGFTSVNAVRAIREKFEELGLDARAFAGLKLAAVGGVTADALREWGLEPDLVPEGEQSARGLLEAWPPYDDVLDPIDRVFLPRADIATETLVAGLQDMGWEVDDVTAYRTVRASPPPAPVREAIKGGAFDAVCFTSASTVRNLVGIAGKPHPNTVVACIGPATATIAQEHGLRVDVVADEPNAVALIDALAEFARESAEATRAAGEQVVRPSQRKAATRRSRSRR